MKPRQRLVANLKRLLAPGMRAYAAAPGESPVEVEANIMAICAAADAGKVKISLVNAEGERIAIDARHGAIKGAVKGDRRATAAVPTPPAASPARAPTAALGSLFLRAIGLGNADGTVSAQNAKKLKQTRHLVELLRPAWEAALAARHEDRPLRVADLACGNAYLSFVLYDALRAEGIACRLHGIESRPELVKNCEERARALSFEGMSFATASIRDADLSPLGGPPDLVLALHACDTATDEAIALAVRAHAPALFVVPCCHAELARQLKGNTAASPALSRHGLLLNDYATTLTDALRAEILDAAGYAVDVVEFIDAGHTPKNRLVRAHRRTSPAPGRSLACTLARIAGDGLNPALARFLGGV
ncbi:MAG: SAM-dependent methyltransferase [Deltaproteobacteria bacterium]|nr:SAM-dependent methyltransferase [Deltaproteobacteria bacterium]